MIGKLQTYSDENIYTLFSKRETSGLKPIAGKFRVKADLTNFPNRFLFKLVLKL